MLHTTGGCGSYDYCSYEYEAAQNLLVSGVSPPPSLAASYHPAARYSSCALASSIDSAPPPQPLPTHYSRSLTS